MPTYQQNMDSSDLLPEGAYPFHVINAEDVTSSAGNEMIRLWLEVNNAVQIIDHLVFTRNAFWKIDQFRIATGEVLGAPNSNASLDADDCIQRKGLVAIGVETWEGRKRNKVNEYLDPSQVAITPQPAAGATRVPSDRKLLDRPDLKREPTDIPF